MKVEIYWNLTRKLFSVRRNGKVVDHVDCFALENVEWVVQPGGRARVRRDKRKNVHAFARGYQLHHVDLDVTRLSTDRVTYNPYKHSTFVDASTKIPVRKSDYALFEIEYCDKTKSAQPRVRYHDICSG